MKILAFADMHGKQSALKNLAKKAEKEDVDYLVCAGDISVFEHALDLLFFRLNKIGKTVLVIPGNHESEEELKIITDLFDNIAYIHKRAYKIGNYIFLGYGGGGFSMQDPRFRRVAKKFAAEIKKEKKKNKKLKVILITHAPPHGTKLDIICGEHCGNKDIKEFIDEVSVNLVISGHLHETAGTDYIEKKTRFVNPGPFGKVIEL